MRTIKLTAKSFNSIQRNAEGVKVQRVWIPELKGLGVDLGKSKKSIIYKYKSPTTGKFRITSLDSFSYSQNLDKNQIEDVVDDYYQLRGK